MGQLLRIGVLLPQWLSGPDLIRESRSLESTCWRELGYPQQPHFADDLPPFLMADGDGQPRKLSAPAEPMELARQMASLEPSPLPAVCIGANFDTLARLLNLTPFELASVVVRRFGHAILPVVPVRDDTHGCEMLAQPTCQWTQFKMLRPRAGCTLGAFSMGSVPMAKCPRF